MQHLLVTGCLLASAACAHGDVVRPSIGAGLVVGATAGAYALGDSSAPEIGLAVGGGSLAAVLPASLLESMRGDRDDPTTPGGIYSSLGSELGKALLLPITFLAPSLATWAIGEELEGRSSHRGRAFGGAFAGAAAGSIFSSFAVTERLPPWARVALTATMIGSFSTLGYQLGR